MLRPYYLERFYPLAEALMREMRIVRVIHISRRNLIKFGCLLSIDKYLTFRLFQFHICHWKSHWFKVVDWLIFWSYDVTKRFQLDKHAHYDRSRLIRHPLRHPLRTLFTKRGTRNLWLYETRSEEKGKLCQMALSATFRKTYKQDMFKHILYIQVKSLVADTLFTCINEYTINKYCIKCVSY